MTINVSATELIIVLFAVAIFFGAGKYPTLRRDLPKSIQEFRDAMDRTTPENADSLDIKVPILAVSTALTLILIYLAFANT